MNGDGLTLVEMLNKEPSLVHLNGGQFIIPSAISDSQPHFQRQNCAKLSVKKIHRPASVPSTKKFEDCGVSIMNNRDIILNSMTKIILRTIKSNLIFLNQMHRTQYHVLGSLILMT